MSATHLKAGLRWAMEISRLGNQYLQDCYQLNFDHGKIPDTFEEVIPAGHKINEILPIFKKIEPEEVKTYREKFGGHH